MNITAWLRGLGLEQYTAAFRDNDIDASVLPELTAEDLAGLGVASIGHRRKLLAAIAALREAPGAAEPVAVPPAPRPPADVAAAERRQVTILFCDVVGSTELATRLDPEDLREVIGAYQHCVAEQLSRFGGFVAKYMGDGILAYFGYPLAHEEDAEQAVRAGLAIVYAVGRLALAQRLEVRLGIATGLVVVGDLLGAGAAQERGVVGETPNLAARLQSLAGGNEIVIADATRRHVGGLFELRDLGPQELKGFAGTVRAWQVLGQSGLASRFEALRSRETPLVGREEELELLLRRWSQASGGEGRVVLLSAEPGIGKSRLAEALAEGIAGEPHVRLRYYCSPHHGESALYPVIGQLERAAGFEHDDDAAAKREKLARLLGGAAAEDLPLLADLLSLPAGPGAAPDFTPQRKKERTFEALLRQLASLARGQPVLMLFEDVHWIDPTSLELLDRTIAGVERLPVLLIATFRPEFQPSWVGQAHVTVLALSRLGRREGTALVERLAANAALPADIVEEILDRTDGVPLFLEEVTKVVLEAAAGAAHGTIAAIPGARATVPATLQASLMARLDRLGVAPREVAQTAAAIGREFSYDLVTAVAARGEAETRAALDRLVAAGLVFQRGTPPAADYQFKHALVQDTAYGTLLRGPRQALHARIAAAIESRAPDRVEREPEILAYHLAEAGEAKRAAHYWKKAGETAVRRAANREAIGHFRRALAIVEAQPEGNERWREELAILSQLAPAMMWVYGWSAPEAGAVVERAAEIGRRLPSSPEIAPSVANLWLFNSARGRFDRSDEIAADLFRIARALDDPEILLQAHHCSWATRFFQARFREAGEHVAAATELYDEERHAHHRHVYLGHDPGVCRLNFASCLANAQGYPDRARRLAEEGLVLARRLNHAASLANALWRACEVYAVLDEPEAVRGYATELLRLADSAGLSTPRFYGTGFLGWAAARLGEVEEGLARLDEANRVLRGLGTHVHATFLLGLRAEALMAAGRYAETLQQANEALEATSQGEATYLSHLHRVRAAALRHLRDARDPEIEADLQRALSVAREQEAKGWEIGAATDLARLWADADRRAEAYELLAPVYDSFTEGFDTADLRAAKAVLDELG
ncbi:MAG TPA: AAA family ATPase [Stellaceae bacterium]|nr:AAA family ATPase [Stellaceae bacterium]